jgi:hypothetical protein
LAGALFALNAALSFHNLWPTPAVTLRGEVAVEVALLVLGLALWLHWRGRLSARLGWLLAVLLLIGTLARYAEVTAPALYGRPVNLYWDARHLGSVVAMIARVATPWQLALGLGTTVLLLLAVTAALQVCVRRLAVALAPPPARAAVGALPVETVAAPSAAPFAVAGARRALLALATLTTLLFVANRGLGLDTGPFHFSNPVAQTWGEQVARLSASWLAARRAAPLQVAPLPVAPLRAAAGADVFVVFIESYGQVALERPALAARIAAGRASLAAAIAATGRQVVSASVESPTFGGGSWLAHASLMSGVEVRGDDDYRRLLALRRATLVDVFRAAGYRTVALMPGLRGFWPEGVLYRFDSVYGAPELDYRGPEFGWWRIPDQFSLARFDALEAQRAEPAGGRAPRFLMFPTISSHMPFSPTPPYQSDWPRMTGPRPYGVEAARALARQPDWTDLGPAYADSVGYTLETLAGYLRQHAGRPLVLVLLGDHQPPAVVSGPGASWQVPVHVISDRAAIIRPLLDAGFVHGLAPPPRRLSRLDEFTALLLRALDAPRIEVAGAGVAAQRGQPLAQRVR